MENVIATLKKGERVSSLYADIYFDDEHCDNDTVENKPPSTSSKRRQTVSRLDLGDDWISPSDLLIGVVKLSPPFTSKITRGITHEGILSIGNAVLANERARFESELEQLIQDNEAAWTNILAHEKQEVTQKVKEVYKKIYKNKSKIMVQETQAFYESTLRELEEHVRAEIHRALVSAHATVVSDMNMKILHRLKNERTTLERSLENLYESEVRKMEIYYRLLLRNEESRSKQLINRAICERNDALHAFYTKYDAETVTATMYVMSIERKKCRIKQFLLDHHQSTDIKEQLQKIKEKQGILDDYKRKEHTIADINREWELKVKRLVQLFLRFISFSLKLLPEQSAFLLDLEKMFVLQLNEIKKQPKASMHILVEDESFQNVFSFQTTEASQPECDKEPFVIEGDTSPDVPPRYGSRETLQSSVDLPTIRLQRQFVYAKCHKYEEIKEFLESQRCKCMEFPIDAMDIQPPESPSMSSTSEVPEASAATESSNDAMQVDDFQRVQFCPSKRCNDRIKREIASFPHLNAYLDFTENNYRIVRTMFDTTPRKKDIQPTNPKDIAYRKLPFSATTESHYNVETQYSSQEDLAKPDSAKRPCACDDGPGRPLDPHPDHDSDKQSRSKLIADAIMKRKTSLRNMLQANPKLLKMLTDESFDFQL